MKNKESQFSATQIATLAKRLVEDYRRNYRNDVTTKQSHQIHIMEMPPFGDISSGNVTGLASDRWLGIVHDPKARVTLAHELVHPFVETGTPRSDRLYCLAIEGFPSYLHLPILAELDGEEQFGTFMRKIEQIYITKQTTGKDSRGEDTPPEKPLLGLKADELPLYKDGFVLGDRALLFLHWLRGQLGKERFYVFTKTLLVNIPLNESQFVKVIRTFLPDSVGDLKTWLETTNYPEKFHLIKIKSVK